MRNKNSLNKTKKYNLQVFNNYEYKLLDINLSTYAEIVSICPIFKTSEEVRNYLKLDGVFKQKRKTEKYSNLIITKIETVNTNMNDFYID